MYTTVYSDKGTTGTGPSQAVELLSGRVTLRAGETVDKQPEPGVRASPLRILRKLPAYNLNVRVVVLAAPRQTRDQHAVRQLNGASKSAAARLVLRSLGVNYKAVMLEIEREAGSRFAPEDRVHAQ